MADNVDTGTYAEEFGPDFQSHILAVCARSPDFILRFRSALDPAYFAAKLDRVVAKALFVHMDEHHVLPHRTTLLESCRTLVDDKEMPAVEKVISTLFKEDISDRPAVERKAINFGKTQAMVNAVIEGADWIDRGDKHKVIPLVQQAALVGEDLLDVGLHYADWETRKARYLAPPEQHQERIIPTGLPHLDYALGGGLRRGELGCVVAPPKRGKTSLLINMGFGALTRATPDSMSGRSGFNVLHLSLEMDQETIEHRYDDRLAGRRKIKIKNTERERYVRHLESRQYLVLGDLYTKSYPTRSLSSTKIRSLLTLLIARGFTPDLLIVDYADIMEAERRRGEMRHEQAGIYEDLRTIAGEYDIAVWTGSQAPRGALDKETITIEDFAESFEKAAIVDCAVGFSQTRDERASIPQECRLFLAACRNQEDGRTIHAHIRRDCCWVRTLQLVDPALGPIELPFDVDTDSGREQGESSERPRRVTRVYRAQDGEDDGALTPKQVAHTLRREHLPKPKKPRKYPSANKKKKKTVKKRKSGRPSKKV